MFTYTRVCCIYKTIRFCAYIQVFAVFTEHLGFVLTYKCLLYLQNIWGLCLHTSVYCIYRTFGFCAYIQVFTVFTEHLGFVLTYKCLLYLQNI